MNHRAGAQHVPNQEKVSKYKQRLQVKAKIDTGLGSSATTQKEACTKSTKSLENLDAEQTEPASTKDPPPDQPTKDIATPVDIELETDKTQETGDDKDKEM